MLDNGLFQLASVQVQLSDSSLVPLISLGCLSSKTVAWCLVGVLVVQGIPSCQILGDVTRNWRINAIRIGG